MSHWTLILCEGAHDQAVIAAIARVHGGWSTIKEAPRGVPQDVVKAHPKRKEPQLGDSESRREYQREPDYLTKNGHYLVIRSLGGKDEVLGELAMVLLGQVNPAAVGVFVDANDKGVKARLDSFRSCYAKLFAHANEVVAGTVKGGEGPRLGMWVAPDNSRNGRLEDLVMETLDRTRPKQAAAGKEFIDAMASIEPGKWSEHRSKAILGAIHQTVSPGASLAVCLQKSTAWLDGLTPEEPLKRLVQFLDELTA